MFRDTTGFDRFDDLTEQLRFLQGEGRPVSINFPITQESVAWLPDLYDYHVNEGHVPLILHYHQLESLNKESKDFIKRFKHIQNVTILKTIHPPDNQCQIVPFSPSYSLKRQQWLAIQESMQWIRNNYSSYFWLKKRYG